MHATGLVLEQTGLLVCGPSGAGKSSLALALIEAAHCRGYFASLVADDQVWLQARGDRLVAEAPAAIAGLIEIRACGLMHAFHERRAVIDRTVLLVEPQNVPRMADETMQTLAGISIPCLALPQSNIVCAMPAVLGWLGLLK